MSKKILFPTDFSAASKNAFTYALKLADAIQAEVVTMHVYQVPQANFVNAAEYLHEMYDVTELSNFENYKDEVPALRKIADENNLNHIKINHVLISGNLVQEVKKMTDLGDYDFVIMGTKGVTSLKETFFGTNATQVMNEIKTVVIVVPENCVYQPVKKILFLTQYKEEDTEPFKTVLSLAHTFGASIDCLHIVNPDKKNVENSKEQWKALVEDKEVNFNSITGDDKEGIAIDYIESNQVSMVGMHVYHRNFFEKLFEISLSKKLAFHINIPILAIHK
ncbi:universal stress protein [Flavobacterium sp. PL12]|uniref:universal stress protein n=1 Tax=Flavobacterium sp. PL12 TaxID=3071718 RepID=UPI00319DC1D0